MKRKRKQKTVLTGAATLEDVIRVPKISRKEISQLNSNVRLARCLVCGKTIMKCKCADGYI